MSFETWCETQAAFNAGVAEMCKPMECEHPKACFGIKGSLLSEDDIFKAKPTCLWCAELAALKAERDKLREALNAYEAAANKFIGKVDRGEARSVVTYRELKAARAILASAPKET